MHKTGLVGRNISWSLRLFSFSSAHNEPMLGRSWPLCGLPRHQGCIGKRPFLTSQSFSSFRLQITSPLTSPSTGPHSWAVLKKKKCFQTNIISCLYTFLTKEISYIEQAPSWETQEWDIQDPRPLGAHGGISGAHSPLQPGPQLWKTCYKRTWVPEPSLTSYPADHCSPVYLTDHKSYKVLKLTDTRRN